MHARNEVKTYLAINLKNRQKVTYATTFEPPSIEYCHNCWYLFISKIMGFSEFIVPFKHNKFQEAHFQIRFLFWTLMMSQFKTTNLTKYIHLLSS